MKTDEQHPFRGIKTWKDTEDNITRIRLHYSADDDKDPATEKGRAWVEAGKKNAPSMEWWNQEQEIDFGARQGARIYQAFKDDETQLCDPFPIPEDANRYFILDTHPRTPHAMLWVAVLKNGDAVAYREYWPSKVYGFNNKPVPEDEKVYPIPWYAEIIKYFESAENPENHGKAEKIHMRIIDYAARAFGKDKQNPDSVDYQTLYEEAGRDLKYPLYFEDCAKDNEAAYAEVNEWLRPRPQIGPSGDVIQRSRLRIFKNLHQLRWELLNCRLKTLQPHQVDVKDPDFKVIERKNNVSDCLKYFALEKREYREKKKRGVSRVASLAVR